MNTHSISKTQIFDNRVFYRRTYPIQSMIRLFARTGMKGIWVTKVK